MFLQLSVSHSVHRGSVSVHAGIHTPLGRHPQGRHSQSRHTPPGSRDPLGADTSLGADTPLCAVHAGRYGQQVGVTHPTGMHTCFTE